MNTDPKEIKYGRAVIESFMEIQKTPKDNVKRFIIVRRQLERAAKKYSAHTKSEFLLHEPAYYGFVVIPPPK